MQVLITGATGYIGGAVAEAVQGAGHVVLGVAHDARAGAEIERRGWRAVAGDLRAPESLAPLARSADAVLHAANAGGADAGEVDRQATLAMLRALDGSGKPFVYTSGVWVLGAGRADERSPARPAALVAWRAPLEREVLAAAPSVRAVVVRPGVVYGRGGGIPGLIARGELPVLGSGRQRWPVVHVEDLARLYLRALAAPAGSVLHGVSSALSMRELALLATGGADAPAQLPESEARARFGAFADALLLDQWVSSEATQETLEWRPGAPTPIEEFLAGSSRSTHA